MFHQFPSLYLYFAYPTIIQFLIEQLKKLQNYEEILQIFSILFTINQFPVYLIFQSNFLDVIGVIMKQELPAKIFISLIKCLFSVIDHSQTSCLLLFKPLPFSLNQKLSLVDIIAEVSFKLKKVSFI